MDARHTSGLQTIFGIFLGLMVSAFVGIGVNTFYPSPYDESNPRLRELGRQEQAIRRSRSPNELSSDDRARLDQLEQERFRLQDSQQDEYRVWQRRTSIILISFATLAMAISLVRAEQLPVISNGLLLGGVFTMLYGVGWIVMTGTSTARFVVMTMALIITLVLGYVRFVRRKVALSAQLSAASEVAGPDIAYLEQRMRSLEERVDRAAGALARPD